MTLFTIIVYALIASLFYGYLDGTKFYFRNKFVTSLGKYFLACLFPITIFSFLLYKSAHHLANQGRKAGKAIAQRKEKKAEQKKQRIAIEKKLRVETEEAQAQAEAELEMEYARLEESQVNKSKKHTKQLAVMLDKKLFPKSKR